MNNRDQNIAWLVPCNKNYYDVEGCYREFGEVYWVQRVNFRVGDTVYLYSSSPDSCIRFKATVISCDFPYTDDMMREVKYYTNPADYREMKGYTRFALFKIEGSTRVRAIDRLHPHGAWDEECSSKPEETVRRTA